jgi:hypothetical protein
MKYHANGEATKNEINTSFKKSFDNNDTIPGVLAPNTLRMPISLIRCSTLNVVNPNRPRQEIKIAIMVKYLMIEASLSSAAYIFLKILVQETVFKRFIWI